VNPIVANTAAVNPTQISPLRQRMIDDMRLRNLALNTQSKYIECVAALSAFYGGRSPANLSLEEIRAYQVHLLNVRNFAASSMNIVTCALRFFYGTTLKRDWEIKDVLPMAKLPKRLPVVPSPEEVHQFLSCVSPREARIVLTICYATGMRISEAVALKPTDIDSKRMVIRVHGKGGKDRDVMLSARLLDSLRDWYRDVRPRIWLFPGQTPGSHISRHAVGAACRRARRGNGIAKRISPHSLRHAFAVHTLEQGADVRTIQLLLGHRSLTMTMRYLQLTTTKVCATTSPLDRLPQLSPTVQPPAKSAQSKQSKQSKPVNPSKPPVKAMSARSSRQSKPKRRPRQPQRSRRS
jgi:integrase/recombinase XerD